MARRQSRRQDFRRALRNLSQYRDSPTEFDVLTLTGFVGLYETCFEQAWKAMKEALERDGYFEVKVGSPRMVLKQAYAARMIQDEHGWLEALQARNEASHTYNEEVAYQIVNDTRRVYLPLFESLETELDANWSEE